tara:strand:+ start:49 stop:834 length:786 start_codon:yes stop_codon:yes gene_type:complete
MTNLKTLSNAKGVQGQIITIVTPLAKEIAQRQLAFMQTIAQRNNQVFIITEFAIESAELSAVVDLFKAVGKYLTTTDTLISMDVFNGTTGVEINAIIARDGEEFKFNTNAIWAGGYNIQREHVRYIVKTDLPKANDKSFSQEVVEAYKAMTKIEKLQNEIDGMKNQITKNNEQIAKATAMSDSQIANDIIERDLTGAWYFTAKFYAESNKLSEAEFNQMISESKKRTIDFWKKQNIDWRVDNNKSLSKSIAKTENKIETLK